jgi:hypothetical protein
VWRFSRSHLSGPIAAGILLIEAGLGLGNLLIPLLIPGLVAAAISFLIFTGFSWGASSRRSLRSGLPPCQEVHFGDLAV